VAVGDLDGDGNPDILVGNSAGDVLYIPFLAILLGGTPVANPFGLANVGIYAVPALADLDADGDLDALVGNGAGALLFFRNTGTAAAPAFAPPVTNPFGLVPAGGFIAPALGDLDGDGDLDAFVGSGNGDTEFFRNSGSAAEPAFAAGITNPLGLATVGAQAAPALADLDRDGDLDALFGAGDGGLLLFLGGPVPPTPTPTASSTATATRMHTRTRTATASPTPAVPPTRTATVPPTVTPPPQCPGDCDGSGSVAISELITQVNIALGNQPASTCSPGDTNEDGMIAVAELVTAVNRAVSGCGG
jgi:uncharacterized protein (DUF2141 family)